MKQLIAIVLLGQLAVVPDAIQKDTARVTKDGVRVGEIRRDVNNPDHLQVYDKKGHLVGTMKKDVLFPDHYRFEVNR